MPPKPVTKPKSKEPSAKRRLAIALLVLALVIGLVVYVSRDSFESHNPELGKHTDVIIEGTVTCNGQPMPGGYVVAWQNGPVVAYGEVRENGTFRMVNAPLGKCLITYSASCPMPLAPRHHLREAPPGANDPENKPGPGTKPPPKGKDKKGEKGFEPKKKDPAAKDNDPERKGKEPGSFDPLAGPPLGNAPPSPIQQLSVENRKIVNAAGDKYGDPSKEPLQYETKKGINSLTLTLTTP